MKKIYKKNKGKISIIIRTYNEEKCLDLLLINISKQTYKNFEVIIVDSGSIDNTLNIANKYDFVKVVEIKKEDFSFGYSLNVGIENSIGEFCLFVSGHCYPVNNDWLLEMVKPFSIDEKIGLVYGKQEGKYSITKFSEHMIFNSWFPDIVNNDQKDPFCNNANCIIRKTIWIDGLKYDEDIMGLEDLVFAKEILYKDHRIVYNPRASVYHIHDETYKSIKNRYEREATTYYSLYPNQRFTFLDLIKITTINIISDISSLFKTKRYSTSINNILGIFRFRFNQFYGTYKGFKLNIQMSKLNNIRKRFYYPKK